MAAEIGGVFCKVNVTSDEDVPSRFRQGARSPRAGAVPRSTGARDRQCDLRPASRSKEDGSIKHFPVSAFDFVIQVNLIGTFRCIAQVGRRDAHPRPA